MSVSTAPPTVDEQVERANASGLQPIVFIHGLWLLPSSWDRWATLCEEAGLSLRTVPLGSMKLKTVEVKSKVVSSPCMKSCCTRLSISPCETMTGAGPDRT